MKLFDIIRRYKWDLGIALKSEGHHYNDASWDFHIIKAPYNKWYADPFILDVYNDSLVILVEEFSYSINRGRIAKLVIDKNSYKIISEKIILELPTHLSFPAIFRIGDNVYIYPENSASGESALYRYDFKNDSIIKESILSKLPLTDAIITTSLGGYFMLATCIPKQNSNELIVFQSDKLGDFIPIQTITLHDNSARSAGDIFIEDGRIIRPAQNCNGGYGVGLVFQEIIRNSDGHIILKELFRKTPYKRYLGMHTYNQYQDYVIVDLHTRRFPIIHQLLLFIKNTINQRALRV